MRKMHELLNAARSGARRRTAVVWPHDTDSIRAVHEAAGENLVEPLLVGDPQTIVRVAAEVGVAIGEWRIIAADEPMAAAATAVRLIREGAADVLMKGLVDTAILLKAVLDPDNGLRTGRVLSHVALFETAGFERLLLLSDAAMNIAPDVGQKQQIILNAVEVAHSLGILEPAVAMLCAREKVNQRMPATMDAQKLQALNREGVIPGCLVSGPLALDNAISAAAARQKGVDDPVAGRADILIAPNIEAGNILYKALVFLAGATNAGIIVGAAAPIVLTSRADSSEAKLNSIAMAAIAGASGATAGDFVVNPG